MPTQIRMPTEPAQGRAERALRPAAEELEHRIEARHGGALRQLPDDAAEREQPAERDDERRDADVGDDEALEAAEQPPRRARPRPSAMSQAIGLSKPEEVGRMSVISSA